MGIQQIDGRIVRTVFATSTDDEGLIIFIEDNKVTTSPVATVSEFKGLHYGSGEYNNIEQWQDSYAAQLNVQPADNEGSKTSTRKAYLRTYTNGANKETFVVDDEGKVVFHEGNDYNNIIVLENSKLKIKNLGGDTIASSALTSWGTVDGGSGLGVVGLNGSFTLPATDTLEEKTYIIANGVATPTIGEYNG